MAGDAGDLIAYGIIGILYLIQAGVEIAGGISRSKKNKSAKPKGRSFEQLTSDKTPRAVLITASEMKFGNDCERLVNIAFRTSQSFPSMMGTYADVIDYMHKELAKYYVDDHFHIIIGENQKFGFSVDDSQHYAEIQQEQYQVLIFSTKQNPKTKPDTHNADSQLKFNWK